MVKLQRETYNIAHSTTGHIMTIGCCAQVPPLQGDMLHYAKMCVDIARQVS